MNETTNPVLLSLFSALSDPTRFAIVERLMAEGELPAGDIQDVFAISAPAISRHLHILRDAGLLARRVDGTKRLYRVRPEAMQQISAWTVHHRDFWQESLARLEAALLEEQNRP